MFEHSFVDPTDPSFDERWVVPLTSDGDPAVVVRHPTLRRRPPRPTGVAYLRHFVVYLAVYRPCLSTPFLHISSSYTSIICPCALLRRSVSFVAVHGSSSNDTTTTTTTGMEIDELSRRAELCWRENKRKDALDLYEQALQLARSSNDQKREGMMCLGIGFALLNVGEERQEKATTYLKRSLRIAEDQGEDRQASFLKNLIIETENRIKSIQDVTDEKKRSGMASKAAGAAFAKTIGAKPGESGTCCRDDDTKSTSNDTIDKDAHRKKIYEVVCRAFVDTVRNTEGEEPSPKESTTWNEAGLEDVGGTRAIAFVDALSERLGKYKFPSAKDLL